MYYTETLALAPNHHRVHRLSMGVKAWGCALRHESVHPACGPLPPASRLPPQIVDLLSLHPTFSSATTCEKRERLAQAIELL